MSKQTLPEQSEHTVNTNDTNVFTQFHRLLVFISFVKQYVLNAANVIVDYTGVYVLYGTQPIVIEDTENNIK